jgi:hypothetical protein
VGGEAGDGGALQREGRQWAGKRVTGLTHCNVAAPLQAVKRTTEGEAFQCEGREVGIDKAVGSDPSRRIATRNGGTCMARIAMGVRRVVGL